MFPYFEIFGRKIYMYAVLAIIGGFLAWLFLYKRMLKKEKVDDIAYFLLWTALGAFIGGHILYGITNIKYFPMLFEASGLKNFFGRFSAVFGGMVFYGGLIGGIIAALIYIKVKEKDLKSYSDNMAVATPVFHGFARIGCFFGGCCYGKPSSFGFQFSHSLSPMADGVRRFPVQLLESSADFLLAGIFYLLLRKKVNAPLFPIYLLCYSLIRFLDEFLRGDKIRGFVFSLSTSQFISIILFAVSLGIIIYGRVRKSAKK